MNQSSSTSVDQEPNNDYSRQLVVKEDIPDTPFKAVKFGEQWYLTLGKYRLTEGMTRDEVIQAAYDTSWERIMQIIQILIDENKERNGQDYEKYLKTLDNK